MAIARSISTCEIAGNNAGINRVQYYQRLRSVSIIRGDSDWISLPVVLKYSKFTITG